MFLGVILDENLSWKSHFSHIANKISKSIGVIYKASFCLPLESLRTLYYSTIYPYLQYCVIVWGLAFPTNIRRIELLEIIDSTNAIIESMSAILIPSGPESGRVPYDLRLETFLQEFSVILKEKNKTITNLQEKLIQVENERDLLKFASQNLDKNTPAKSIINEPLKQKSNQSNGNANLDINIQSADLNKENIRSLYIPLPVTPPNGVLLKSVNNLTDSMSDESFKPRNHNKLSEILINKHPKQRTSQDVESIQPSGKLSTPNTKINFVDKHNRHKISHDKAEFVPLEKRKKNPFRKRYFRYKPPLLRRPKIG